MAEIERIIREQATPIDLAVPVEVGNFPVKEGDCFGKDWDLGTRWCPKCADKELCGIIFQGTVNKRAKKLEQEVGTAYLDEADLAALTPKRVLNFIQSGETTTAKLIAFLQRTANVDDMPTLKEWVKRFKADGHITIKEGVVWKL